MNIRSKAAQAPAEGLLEALRDALAGAAGRDDKVMMAVLAPVIVAAARAELVAEGPNPGLRAWHPFLLDASALFRPLSKDQADQLEKAAHAVRRSIALAERNPADQLASRPASRRILLALGELGGQDCPQARVREIAGQSQTHFSNGVRILTSAGFLTSRQDERDGRERRLSLTDAGRAAIPAPGRIRGSAKPTPLHVTTPDRRSHAASPAPLRHRPPPEGRRYQSTLERRPVLESQQ